jgi:hypothetical protein
MSNQTISINDTSIELAKGLKIDMGSLEISPIEIDEIALSNFKSDFGYDSGILKNAKMKFEIDMDIHYSIGLRVRVFGKTVFRISESGSTNLLSFDSGFIDVDDVTISPGRMKIDIPQLKLKFKSDSLKISPDKSDPPIKADEMNMKKVDMAETVIPRDMPAIFGGAVIPVQNPLEPQDISICDIKMDEFTTLGIKLPPFELTNLAMADMHIDKVISDEFTTTANVQRNSPILNLFGIVRLWASVSVKTTMQTDKIELYDLDGNIKTDKTRMSGMDMMLKIKDITIKNMEIENFDAKELGIGL